MTPEDRSAHERDARLHYWRRFTPTVHFDEPKEVVGELIRLEEQAGANGPVPRLKIRLDDGQVVVVLGSQARLLAALVDRQPVVGDRIRIRYTGEASRAAKGMSPAKEFTVDVRRPEEQAAS